MAGMLSTKGSSSAKRRGRRFYFRNRAAGVEVGQAVPDTLLIEAYAAGVFGRRTLPRSIDRFSDFVYDGRKSEGVVAREWLVWRRCFRFLSGFQESRVRHRPMALTFEITSGPRIFTFCRFYGQFMGQADSPFAGVFRFRVVGTRVVTAGTQGNQMRGNPREEPG